MRILVRTPNWIGDQILAYPFFHHLRAAYPEAHIAAACAPWVEDVQFRNLVSEVIVLPKRFKEGLRAKFDHLELCAKVMRDKGPWDLAISLPNSFSAAYTLWRAGAKTRRGYRGEMRKLFLNEALVIDEKRHPHRAEAYVQLLPESARPSTRTKEFWGVEPENDLDPGTPGVIEEFDPIVSWPDAKPCIPPKGDYWVLAPGSTAESRRYPAEYFAELAREIVAATGLHGIIVGGPAEAPIGHELARQRELKLIDWTAQGSVTSIWPIFKGAKFTVSNDSGLAHMSALMGCKTQIVWGAGNPKRTEPLGPGRVRIALNPVDCWPCERNVCQNPPGLKLICLGGIQPDAVWRQIKSALKPL